MKYKKLISVFILSVITISSFNTVNIYASDVITERISISDTFTFENIDNTLTSSSDHSSEYIITSTNTVKANGDYLFGTGEVTSSKDWVDVVTDVSNTKLDNIVKISAGAYNVCFLKDNGDLYYASNVVKYATKLPIPEKVVDAYSIGSSALGYFIFALTEDGNVYVTKTDSGIQEITKVETDKKFTKMFRQKTGGRFGYGIVGVLTEDNNLYTVNHLGVLSTTYIPNVEKMYRGYNVYDAVVQFTNKSVAKLNMLDMSISKITYNSSTNLPFEILNIVSGDDYQASIPLVVTTDGLYALKSNDELIKSLIKTIPVDATNKNFILGEDSKFYSYTNTDTELKLSAKNEVMSIWANENPVVSDTILANFSIPYDSILKRDSNYNVEFSLVTKSNPKAFNIYYAKSENMSNRDKWITLETNKLVSDLDIKDYDTGFKDSQGIPVIGKTYTYNWKIGTEDLTNIQLIIEPIY